ncbi:cytochrome P450 like protein [Zymoseptoria brevis]|uniref:Cytochrome P450 like protein n=1 Tax=Zymoseptoria brevis TaxID=1047168 RepID=A0A0F4GAT4_9PEZI|nr:cytochrome P450 like protein [Zymoseptoria brevis]
MTVTSITYTAAIAMLAFILFSAFPRKDSYPELTAFWGSQRWVGVRQQWASTFRAQLRTLRNTRQMITEGYEKYAKRRLPFVLPQLNMPSLLLLPVDDLAEVLRLPEHKVDHFEPNLNAPGVKYTLGPDFTVGPHVDFIRQELTRGLPRVVGVLGAELDDALERTWPLADLTDWQPFKAYPASLSIICQVLNRVFCGPELCRDPRFLKEIQRHSKSVFTAATVLQLLPQACRPILAPIFAYYRRKHFLACKKYMLPVIRKRLSSTDEASDALGTLVQASFHEATNDTSATLDEDAIVRYILLLNLLALFTTSMAGTYTLFNLFGSPTKDALVDGLRDECTRRLPPSSEEIRCDHLESLLRIDSTIRESLRVSPLVDVGTKRLVVQDVNLRSGLRIPAGVCIASPVYQIHVDPKFYPEQPETFDAFRFSRPLEVESCVDDDGALWQKETPNEALPLTATRTDFLSFGYGRHGCPGRFFASHVLKLMLAKIIMRYDVEVRGVAPHVKQISVGNRPVEDVEVWIRKRRGI